MFRNMPRAITARRFAALAATAALILLPSLALPDHPVTTLGGSAAGSINTPSAIAPPQGVWGASFLLQVIEFDALSDEQILAGEGGHSTDRVINPSLNLSYGLLPDLMIGVNVPFIQRQNFRQSSAHDHGAGSEEHDHGEDPTGTGLADLADAVGHEAGNAVENATGGEGSGNAEPPTVENVGNYGGLGDTTVYAQYTLMNTGRHALAGLLGVKLPTGETNVKHDGERIETPHQPGSGSYDPMFGLTYSGRSGFWALDAGASYILTTEGDHGYELGDVLNYNLSLAHRFSALEHDASETTDAHLHWDLVGEINGEYRGDEKLDGRTLEKTAAHVIYVSPGIRLAFPSGLNGFFSLGVPVFTDIQEIGAEPKLRGLGGVSYAW